MQKRTSRLIALAMLTVAVCSLPVVSQTTISVYHRNEPREIEWMQLVKEEFEAANPDIRVELVPGVGGGGPQYAERLAVLWAAGNAPDVFYGAADKAGFILNRWTLDLTDYIDRSRDEIALDEFFPGVFEAATRRGRVYGVPAIAMGHAVFYNKQLLDEAGLPRPPVAWDDPNWDWTTFVQYAERLTRVRENGRMTQVGASSLPQFDFIWMNGGDIFSADAYATGIADHVTLLSPEVVEAYSEIQRLYVDNPVFAQSPASVIDSRRGFDQGRVAMEWVGWWRVREYVQAGLDFEWGIAPVPLVENRSNTRFSDPWFISSVTNHPEEAWRFVKYVTSREGQEHFSSFVAFPPSRSTSLDVYLDTVSRSSGMAVSEVLTVLAGALDHSRPALDEVIGGASVWEPIITNAMSPVLRGERPVEDGLEEAQRLMNASLQEMAERWRELWSQ